MSQTSQELNNQTSDIYLQIQSLGKKYYAKKILLFGSRARGDNKQRSDIDIAVYGIDESDRLQFNSDIDDNVKTLLKFDIIHITENTDKSFLENIEKEGVLIYG